MDLFSIIFYTSPVLLLLACGFILWLVWANQRLRHAVSELERDNTSLYEAGKVHGWAECERKWRDEPLYQMGREAGERAGYIRASVEQLGIVAEMDVVRQSGELTNS